MMIRQETEDSHNNNNSMSQPRCCFTSLPPRQSWTSPVAAVPSSSSISLPLVVVRLCPSMDLLARLFWSSQVPHSTNASSSVVLQVHRTLNGQRIASTMVRSRNDDSVDDDDDDGACGSPSPTTSRHQPQSSTNTTTTNTMEWSPDGRFVAVALNRQVHIYSVEGLLRQRQRHDTIDTMERNVHSPSLSQSDGTGVISNDDDDDDDPAASATGHVITVPDPCRTNHHRHSRHSHSMPPPTHGEEEEDHHLSSSSSSSSSSRGKIVSLSWVHLGSWCDHYAWPTKSSPALDPNTHFSTTTEDPSRIQYLYDPTQQIMDYQHRSRHVLPPSHYYHRRGDDDDDDTVALVSSGQNEHHDNDYVGSHTTADSSSKKSMSLLCLLTESGHLSIYLHGRYPIVLNIPQSTLLTRSSALSSSSSDLPPIFHPIVASPDLTHFVTAVPASSRRDDDHTPRGTVILIHSFPALSQRRNQYESMTSLYGQTLQHMETIQKSLTEIVATWRSAFKSLDLKLDGLQKLWINYGLLAPQAQDDHDRNSNSIRSLLIQYILSGHTTQNGGTTLSNAIDQFFTSVPMNDQLVQRMGVTLFQTLATLESTVRKCLVAPATALVHTMNELYGLSAYHTDLFQVPPSTTAITTTTNIHFPNAHTNAATKCLQLLQASQQLLLTVNTSLTGLMEARGRIRTLVAWLRSTGAAIKARGTAANSVQRENAKKRRISESVLHQLLSFLQEESNFANENSSGSGSYVGLTETILNLRFVDTLSESLTHKENQTPTNNISNNVSRQHLLHEKHVSALPSTVPLALQKTSGLVDEVFVLPRSLLLQSMKQTLIRLPAEPADNQCLAITTRLGQGGINPMTVSFGEPIPSGYFSPTVPQQMTLQNESLSSPVHVRQWLVVAECHGNLVQLHSFPLTWTHIGDDGQLDCDDDDDDDNDGDSDMIAGLYSKSKWSVSLHLPEECTIRDVAFYSDDGKSTLSSASTCYGDFLPTISATGMMGQQEGRQSLGLLISRPQTSLNAIKDERVELWLVPYDDLEFTCDPLQSIVVESNSIKDSNVSMYQCHSNSESFSGKHTSDYTVLPMPVESHNDEADAITGSSENILLARTRNIFDAVDFASYNSSCHLVLSGSRGIGAVLWNHRENGNATTTTTLEILDMEEDEEEEDVELMDDEEA